MTEDNSNKGLRDVGLDAERLNTTVPRIINLMARINIDLYFLFLVEGLLAKELQLVLLCNHEFLVQV
jgi:hypothetical protein